MLHTSSRRQPRSWYVSCSCGKDIRWREAKAAWLKSGTGYLRKCWPYLCCKTTRRPPISSCAWCFSSTTRYRHRTTCLFRRRDSEVDVHPLPSISGRYADRVCCSALDSIYDPGLVHARNTPVWRLVCGEIGPVVHLSLRSGPHRLRQIFS